MWREIDETNSNTMVTLLDSIELGACRNYAKGEFLYYQGDCPKSLFIVKSGMVKVSHLSEDGRIYTEEFLGFGRILGISEYLTNNSYQSLAETTTQSEIYVISLDEFNNLIQSNSFFSLAVIKELSRHVQYLTKKNYDFSLNDVKQRLWNSLITLAEEHGFMTENGVLIDIDITHEEIAELIAANRSTVTLYLKELQNAGLVEKRNRHLLITPPEHLEYLERIKQSIIDADENQALELMNTILSMGIGPLKALNAIISCFREIDEKYQEGVFSLPDILGSAETVNGLMPVISQAIEKKGFRFIPRGTIILGTVYGDIHDIGKTILKMLLLAEGFTVRDLGVNISREEFTRAINTYKPDILGMSAFLTSTVHELISTLKFLQSQDAHRRTKIIVGGSAVNKGILEIIPIDGYAPTARKAVDLAKQILAVS